MFPLALLLPCFLAPGTPQSYDITGLGTPTGNHRSQVLVHVEAINNRGHAAGGIQSRNGWRAFFHDGHGMVEIVPVSGTYSRAWDLNDSDVVVGETWTRRYVPTRALVWDAGTSFEFDLGAGTLTRLFAIDAFGWVAGTYQPFAGADDQSFVRDPSGRIHHLDPPGVLGSEVRALNDFGQAVGSGLPDLQSYTQALLWSYPNPVPTNLGSLGTRSSFAWDVDSYGRIVGSSFDAQGLVRAFLWENGVMTQLPGLPGSFHDTASAIADDGTIVGISTDASGDHGVMWKNGTVVRLDSLIAPVPGTRLTWAADVNELGEIVGTGTLNGRNRSWKMTPILQRPRITGVVPPRAGVTDACFGLGFQPGTTVAVVGSTQPGFTLVPGCGALTVDVGAAELLATTVADADGRIETPLHPPAFLAGRTAYLQAVDLVNCIASEPVVQNLL